MRFFVLILGDFCPNFDTQLALIKPSIVLGLYFATVILLHLLLTVKQAHQ